MIPQSREVRIETCTHCNYTCTICPRDTFTRPKEVMSLRMFQNLIDKIIEEVPEYKLFVFSGFGEPLLDSTILSKIAYVKCSDFKVTMITNGLLLTPIKLKQLKYAGLDSIRVSVVNDFAVTYLWLDLSTANVTHVEVWKPHNWVDGLNIRTIGTKKVNSCNRPFKGPLQVQVDGTVNMCCFDYNGKLLLGDLKTQSLEEIFSSEAFRHIEACHKSGRFDCTDIICKDCDQRNMDKSDVLMYSSKVNTEARVNQTSSFRENLR